MGLIYHSTDKDVEQREWIKELKAINKELVEKLLDIECKLKDVRASTNDLIKELQTLNQMAKKGAKMMKIMVDGFDKTKAENDALRESIKQKGEDILGLVTRIVGKYDKVTLKACYKLLNECKQGLLIDADVFEQIELYKEFLIEVEASLSTPITNVEPPTSAIPSTTNEINRATFKPHTTDESRYDLPESEKAAEH